ncbi:EF-hand calcium-binding domain-containing protein 12 [Sphaerodactylus townsendi]|uniref:Uncharacterized protein n=1 Tax=Sphaerodactylus townsendi TaxID=933632 RepID=A0ACB8EHF8_9SAUR|nr:EF-hand calcium-binding domain-containing protein 12 [Sphaerodactylus townsendi]
MPCVKFVPMERTGRRPERRSQRSPASCTARPAPSGAPAGTKRDGNIMPDELLKEGSEHNLDGFIQHCFKRYKLREKHPNVFFKLEPSRFGRVVSRRRIIIAPPMQGASLPRAKPPSPELLGQKQEMFAAQEHLKEVTKIPTEEDKVRELAAWIEDRKKLRNLLNQCADVELWLMEKESISDQEAKILRKIKEAKEVKKAQMNVQLAVATSSTEEQLPARKTKRTIPVVTAPYPESLITLQNLLQKQKLKLVDVFGKEDRSRTMNFKREDFIRIIEKTRVPVSKADLEDVVVYLTSTRKGQYITHSDLIESQKIWSDYLKEQWKQAKESKEGKSGTKGLPPTVPKVGPVTSKGLPSSCGKSKVEPSQKPASNYLEVPPTDLAPDRMQLSYNTMEEVGKRYREVRRRLKRKMNPLEWAENCRVVKTGDRVVDEHCKPSTIEGDMGELVDQHRMTCHLVWFQCVKLCEQYGVQLTEKLLKRALLYPGDRLLHYEGIWQKLRQPGGYYEVYDEETSRRKSRRESRSKSREQPKRPSKKKERKQERKPEKQLQKDNTTGCRWLSYTEFRNLTKWHSKRLRLATQNLWDDKSCSSLTSEAQEQFENLFTEREMRKMFRFLNPKTDPNSFWPGHVLDKLRLYLPQMKRDEGDALFSHVSRAHPVYPGTYHPHRSWPVSELKFVTYGDPDSRKNYYV